MKDWRHCYRCNLDFSPKMMDHHLEYNHLICRCQLCSAPMLRMGLSRSPVDRAQFCSSECMATAEQLRLCIGCCAIPNAKFMHGACADCRQYGHYVIPAITAVADQLKAIRRARYLPRPYQRRERLPA